MLKITPLQKGLVQVKSTQRINHPKADLITIQIGHDAECNFPESVEIAFSKGYMFLTDLIPDFSPWAVMINDAESMLYYNMRSQDQDALVLTYKNVPLTSLAKFLNMYAEKSQSHLNNGQ